MTDAEWIDVSLPLDARNVAWEGLEPPRLSQRARIRDGDAVNLGEIRLSLHAGTHADAPWHVDEAGPRIDQLPLAPFLGPALLVRTAREDAITRAELEALGVGEARPERLLVATPRPYDGRRFPERALALEPEAARWLAARGLRLLGVDQPSLDPLDSRTLESHHALLGAGVCVLESLALRDLAAGWYELAALPLRIAGGDASPVRAALRPLEGPGREPR